MIDTATKAIVTQALDALGKADTYAQYENTDLSRISLAKAEGLLKGLHLLLTPEVEPVAEPEAPAGKTYEQIIADRRRDQMSKEALQTLVGEKIVGAEHHGSHGAEYILYLESGRSLYITQSDYTKDLYFNFSENRVRDREEALAHG